MPIACVDSSLQLSISAETIHTASHFKLLSEYKTWPPSSPKHGKMPVRVTVLALTSVFCTIAAPVPFSSLSSKISGKDGGFNSTYICSVDTLPLFHLYPYVLCVYGRRRHRRVQSVQSCTVHLMPESVNLNKPGKMFNMWQSCVFR